MPIPYWAGHYIGLPFCEHGRDSFGLDCWGLARMVLSEQFGVSVPSYTQNYSNTYDQTQLGALRLGRQKNVQQNHKEFIRRLYGRHVNAIICWGMIVMLSACANVSHGDFCQIYRPVYMDKKDTERTKQQIDLNNVVWLKQCSS